MSLQRRIEMLEGSISSLIMLALGDPRHCAATESERKRT
jgi:hypothetical protein